MSERIYDINEVLARILSKESSVQDLLILNSWLNEDEKNMKIFFTLKDYMESPTDVPDSIYAELSYDEFSKTVQWDSNPVKSKAVNRNNKKLWLFSIAASFLLLIGISAFHIIFFNETRTQNYYTYVSNNDISNITLPDGTDVILNHDSKITYNDQFDKNERIVQLEGEAFFDVIKSKDKKFIVELGDSEIEVLGTKFNISSRPENNNIVATLIEGRILFKYADEEVALTPNQQIILNKSSAHLEKRQINPETYLAWKDKLYRYNSISLSDLALELERIYGLKILVNDSLQDIKISGSFKYGESFEQVMSIMQRSIKCRWLRDSDTIHIQ